MKTLKDLKRDLLSDLPRPQKTPPPDPAVIERRILTEALKEVAGEKETNDELETVEDEPMIDVYQEARRRGIQLPDHLAQPFPTEASVMDPSMHRENGDDSFLQQMLLVEPAASRKEIENELPEATVDLMADMGLFAGDSGLRLFNSLVARERTTDEQIRQTVRERQAGTAIPPVPTDHVSILHPAEATPEVSIETVPDVVIPPEPREVENPSPMQAPDLPEIAPAPEIPLPEVAPTPEIPQPEVASISIGQQQDAVVAQAEPQPNAADTTGDVSVPVPQQKKKKRRRKPRKQRSPSPLEYVEFPEMHRELIRHKRKPRKIRENKPPILAFTSMMMDNFAGIDDYGSDGAPYPSSDEESSIVPTQRPAPAISEGAAIADVEMPMAEVAIPDIEMPMSVPDVEMAMPEAQPEMADVSIMTPLPRPSEALQRTSSRFITITDILSPRSSLIEGIRDVPQAQANKKRFTVENMAYSYLNERSQQALMTPEERAMTPDELLLHNLRQAAEQAVSEKGAASGTTKAPEPVLYQKFPGRGETMVRFYGLNNKIEEHPEYAIETVSVYFQLRFFMKKNQWRMKWDDIWHNFKIPEKETTKTKLELRLYYLSDKGLVHLHCDDEGDIIEVEIKVKQKTAEEKKAAEEARKKAVEDKQNAAKARPATGAERAARK